MESLIDLANTFIFSNEKNIQFDFFRENNQVLLQCYKQNDVNNWEIDFYSEDNNTIVIELRFHKDKTNNKLNYKRFLESKYKFKFSLVEKDTFFIRVNSGITSFKLIEDIKTLITDIYLYDGKLKFTLNAY